MKLLNCKLIVFLLFAGLFLASEIDTVVAQTPLGDTTVTQSLRKMLDSEGEFTQIIWADGSGPTTTDPAGGGGGKFVDGADTNDAVYTIGDVGIGTTTPSTALEVIGEVNATTFTGSGSGLTGTDVFSIILESPAATDDQLVQQKFDKNITITKISCSVDAGTTEIQFDERVEATPNTAGTNVLTSNLSCSTTTGSSTIFSNALITADDILNLNIGAVTSSTLLRIHVEYDF